MSEPRLTPEDYRWTAALPEDERRLIVDLVRLLDARFIDGGEPSGRPRPCFVAELDDDDEELRTRHVTQGPS